MPAFIDLTGHQIGRLTVLYRLPDRITSGGNSLRMWKCRCSCGKIKAIGACKLRNGETKSCGCLQRELSSVAAAKALTTHGMAYSKEYEVWHSMKQRCNNPNNKNYNRYGGRGISVCDEWNVFENFYRDMGNVPKGKTIGRKDNDGNYEPSNCRWESKIEQGNNRRNSVFLQQGNRRQTISQWAREFGLTHNQLRHRLSKNPRFLEVASK